LEESIVKADVGAVGIAMSRRLREQPRAIVSRMNLPFFSPSDDPGPSFTHLLDRHGLAPDYAAGDGHDRLEISHGTTVVAVRYADGVVIAGDRRATSGNLISHRTMQKVFMADRWSGIAIAGAAGPAVEMVKLLQLQHEHNEKVEGHSLSLEGKANQLSQMLRNHLPAAMQGLVVVPIFAGFDRRREYGRLFAFDVTGGRYEEEDYVASGSGSLHARTVIKLGHQDDLSREAGVDLLIKALFTAADEDSATGGPDSMRGIFPIVATINAEGYAELEEQEISDRFDTVIAEFTERA
jgi:proteasome beta subunit